MGSIQILTKCCNDDLEIDNDDNEKPPLVIQQPTIKDKSDKLITTDSFNTTLPCAFLN